MNQEITASTSIDHPRCEHSTARGRRCKLPVLESSDLCFRHAAHRDSHSDSTDLSSAFADKLSQFHIAVEIHDFVAQLTTLLVQSRISCRRASVLAFCSQLLLRTLPAIEHEANQKEPTVIVNMEDPHNPGNFIHEVYYK